MNIRQSLIDNIMQQDIKQLLFATYNPIGINEYKKHYIVITHDDIAQNPREFNNLFKFIFFHKRYTLGDNHNYFYDNYENWKELEQAVIDGEGGEDNIYLEPVYAIDHAHITLSPEPFACTFDSGKLGFAVIKKEIAEKLNIIVNEALKKELDTYNAFLNSETYGFYVYDNEGNPYNDGCFYNNFYGDYDDELMAYAKETIDSIIYKENKQP